MDWVARMNQAINFIETHIDEDFTIDDVVREVHSSRYHFHRMFLSMLGITPAEYIRRRRLTLAAKELVFSDARVVDVANRFGYSSPNAFTRAFRDMHGVNPGEVRKGHVALSAHERVSIHINKSEARMLDYKIVEKPEFTVLGKSKEFDLDHFISDGPKFWKQYVGTNEYRSLLAMSQGRAGTVSEAPVLSAYFPVEDGNRDMFTDVLGVEVETETESKRYSAHFVPAATYAEFTCTYQTSMKTNRQIYGQWFAATGYERDGLKPDIVSYFPLAFRPMKEMIVRWWIPVVKPG